MLSAAVGLRIKNRGRRSRARGARSYAEAQGLESEERCQVKAIR